MLLVTKKAEGKSFEDISVVVEFIDTFINDLSRLLPIQDIEFGIDLEPGANLVHKAPYRMALTKLKELKVQL